MKLELTRRGHDRVGRWYTLAVWSQRRDLGRSYAWRVRYDGATWSPAQLTFAHATRAEALAEGERAAAYLGNAAPALVTR